MLIWTARVPKKKTAAVLAVLLLGALMAAAVLLAGRADSREAAEVQLEDNGDRVAYLESLGWQVEGRLPAPPESRLPAELEEPYLTYNELQSAQGFDLAACCGKQVSRYTYTVTNYPGRAEGVQANLYVCQGRPWRATSSAPGRTGSRTPWSTRRRRTDRPQLPGSGCPPRAQKRTAAFQRQSFCQPCGVCDRIREGLSPR